MFGLFSKKNKSASPCSADNTPSKLAELYDGLLKIRRETSSELDAVATTYNKEEDFTDSTKWMDALAVCDAALENKALTTAIKELYRQIYAYNWNKYVSMQLDDVDYKFWFDLNKKINNRFIEAGHYRAYAEQADLLSSARRPYRDYPQAKECYMKGISKEDATSMGCYGYELYYGIHNHQKPDKEEGLRLMQRSKELGYESADILLLLVDFYDNKNNDELLDRIQKYSENAPDKRKAYYILSDYYLREGRIDEAAKIMKKGMELKDKNCEYLYGMNVLRGQITEVNKAEGIKHLENAFYYYAVYAGNFLGQYYYYANDENSSVVKAIEWHKKAVEYYSADSAFELGIIYSYNDECKDAEKGIFYLDMAIEEENHRAMSEKAYILINKENADKKDIDEAKMLFEKAMELGNDYAPYRLGLATEKGEFGEEPNYAKALELYELAAERGSVLGMEAAGHYYRLNYVNEDEGNGAKAVEYFQKAIERNSNYSRVELALCHETGTGTEKNYQKAFDLYEQAAQNGYPFANLKMAYYYEDGLIGEKEDLAKALENFQKAADNDLAEGMYNVGRFYRYAVGLPENPQLAIENFLKASEGGDGQAMIEMAAIYEYEYGGYEFDAQKAMDYMQQAADMGYPYAQYKVGYYHYYGLIEQDIKKGMEWFNKSYERGYPYAALMLGNYYLYNHGGEKEYDKAFEYYKFAEERNCMNEGLGICYEFGFGVEENNTEAIKYYNLAAEKDNVAAKYRLGLCYKYGTGTTENMTEAYNWFEKAVEDDHLNAQYEMAMMLLDGIGVAQDETRATQMLAKIAKEDHDDAQLELGNCYLTGRGVPEDEAQAMVWYQKAADNGNEQAQKLTGKRERRKR